MELHGEGCLAAGEKVRFRAYEERRDLRVCIHVLSGVRIEIGQGIGIKWKYASILGCKKYNKCGRAKRLDRKMKAEKDGGEW